MTAPDPPGITGDHGVFARDFVVVPRDVEVAPCNRVVVPDDFVLALRECAAHFHDLSVTGRHRPQVARGLAGVVRDRAAISPE